MKAIQGWFRAAALVISVLAFAVGAPAQNQNSNDKDSPKSSNNTWPYAATGRSAPVLAVVGDVSCQPGETEPGGEKSGESCASTKSPYNSTPGILWQSQEATANEIETIKPDLVAILGDLQYQVGQYSDFEGSYDLTYGAFKMITRPAPGNHEFYDEHAATGVAGYGYFSYFNGFQIDGTGAPVTATIPDPCPSGLVWNDPNPPNPYSAPATPCGYQGMTTPNPQPVPRADGQAGHFEEPPDGVGVGVGDGWYSYNLGDWHLISLNIECSTQPGGCSTTGSWFASELQWLQNDLEANHSSCTLAYWHQPTFSATNGITQEGATAQAFWQLLYQHHADLVLNGHDHLYARYRPLNPNGIYDPNMGIREFTVGTGGETLDPIVVTTVTSAQVTPMNGLTETNQEDPSGNVNFNALNLQAYSGDYWGVMALTLNKNGYAWDYESALLGPTVAVNGPTLPAPAPTGGYSDKGVGYCHGQIDR
ncbi:MAG: metallophosphoesterase [Terracidiphilus sp.]